MGKEKIDLFDKYFRLEADKSITFIGTKLCIKFPEAWIDKGIVEFINKDVFMLGLFEGYIFDSLNDDDFKKAVHKYTMKSPSKFQFKPSIIETFDDMINDPVEDILEKVKMVKLTFLEGDTYIKSVNSISSVEVMKAFGSMVLNNWIPYMVTYDELPKLWNDCNQANTGGDMGVNFASLCSIVAGMTRCPDDLTVPFRVKYEKYAAKGIHNGVMIRLYDVPKFTSNFASLTSADAKHGLTVAMKRRRVDHAEDVTTPIEEAIK